MPDRTPEPFIPTTDSKCRQPLISSPLLKSIPAPIVSVALRDLAYILSAKSPLKTIPYNNIKASETSPPNCKHSSISAEGDMKFPFSASIASKKTTVYCKEKKEKDTQDTSSPPDATLDNTISMFSPEEQQSQQQRQERSNDDNNNDNSNENRTLKRKADNLVFSCVVTDTVNNNLNENKNEIRKMKMNDNERICKDVDSVMLRRARLQRIDSGFSSSGSDEDATDKTSKCQCDSINGKHRPRKSSKHLPHRLSLSRSQSWSSLDSAVGDCADRPGPSSPSASSVSSLSSMWSLTSSGNNLSLSPSLDSQLWNSLAVSNGDTTVSDTTTEQDLSGSALPSDLDSLPICDVVVSRTLRGSEISSVDTTRPSTQGRASQYEREQQEDSVDGTTFRDNSFSSTTPATPFEIYAHAVSAQPARNTRRRPQNQSRDHNNNRGVRRGVAPQEYLPNAPCRLGDYFQQKGVLAFVALIIYTLSLMAVFAVLRMIGRSLKAAVGKQDLKEMRKSLAQSRRSRRAPATSG